MARSQRQIGTECRQESFGSARATDMSRDSAQALHAPGVGLVPQWSRTIPGPNAMSNSPHSIHVLEAEDHLRHQAGEWLAERIGWGVIGTVLLAAIVGFLGPGPISHRRHASGDTKLVVEYDAIGRALSPARLRVQIAEAGRPLTGLDPESRGFRVSLPRSFIDATVIEHIVPEPARTEAGVDEVVYTFGKASDNESQSVTFHYQYEEFGSFTHRIRVAGKEPAVIRQWILP
jgi:hypothetical protein